MHERRYQNDIDGLRNSERVERINLEKVARITLNETTNTKTLLDIGTGSGLFAEKFANLNIEVTGLDVNFETLKVAMQYLPHLNFQLGIAEKMPYPNNTFDLAFMGYLLHETDDYVAAMKESYRVVCHQLTVLEWPDFDQTNGPPRHHRLSHEQIINFANQAGFSQFNKYALDSAVLYNFKK